MSETTAPRTHPRRPALHGCAAADTEARDYHFRPEPMTARQTDYLRRHMVYYSGPGEIGGIRQYEQLDGRVNWVRVHPSFPATPTMISEGTPLAPAAIGSTSVPRPGSAPATSAPTATRMQGTEISRTGSS